MRWSDRGLTPDEVARLYSGYRGAEYFEQRHAFEPWYTRRDNDGIGGEDAMLTRRKFMLQLMRSNGIDSQGFSSVSDYGGDRGQMLADFAGANKFVFDLSLVDTDPGVQRLDKLEDGFCKFDLVLNCHVLEHMSDPLDGLRESVSLVRSGGLVYIEVPDEIWSGPFQPRFQKDLLNRLCEHPSVLKLADFLCTASRVKTRWIFPLGFVAIREHLNYFTHDALRALMASANLDVICCVGNSGALIAIGRKR